MPYFVIVWREVASNRPQFFRGDDRYEVFLPYVCLSSLYFGPVNGWVEDERYARIFDAPIVLDSARIAKYLDVSRINVYPYTGPLLPTQILRPTRRPNRGRYPQT